MSAHEPRRLLAYGGELRGLVRDALDAERADAPADAARLGSIEQKIAAQIGAAAAVSMPPRPPAPPAATTPAAPTSAWLGGKASWVALASLAVVGALALSLSLARSDSAAPASTTTPRAPSAFVPQKTPLSNAGSASETANVPTLSPADLPSAPPAVSSGRAAARAALDPTTPPAATAATDGEEIALLARAHDALHASPAESLQLCREHEARFANGHFAQEREAVAIEALVYLNRGTEAAARWNEFKARYPTSSHRVHLDSLFPPASAPAAP
jgi:hypothetical protein